MILGHDQGPTFMLFVKELLYNGDNTLNFPTVGSPQREKLKIHLIEYIQIWTTKLTLILSHLSHPECFMIVQFTSAEQESQR